MNLYLTNHANVRKTNFCNVDGQVLYKSETPGYATRLVPNQKTTISKVVPNDSPEIMSTLSHLHILPSLSLLGSQPTRLRTWRLLNGTRLVLRE